MDTRAPDAAQEQASQKLKARDEKAHEEYKLAFPGLYLAGKTTRDRCLSLCKDCDLSPTPTVSARVKEWEKLLPKIQNGVADPWDKCSDLIGVKIVVLSSKDVEKTRKAVQEIVLDNTEQNPKWYESGPRAKGYQALHVAIQISPDANVPTNTRKMGAELQIVTALQDAWGAFSHDDFYKSREGVPFEFAKRALRLAAVMDLADDEIQALRSNIQRAVEKEQEAVTGAVDDGSIPLDEVTLIAAAATTLKQRFIELRELGRSADFQASGFAELVKPGFEVDIFLRLASETRTYTLSDLRRRCDEALQQQEGLSEVFSQLKESGRDFDLFDRPLQVLQVSMMLKPENENVVWPLTPAVMDAIKKVKDRYDRSDEQKTDSR